MTFTLHEGFVLQAKSALTALAHILHKAEEHPRASAFPSARLHDDMKSLSYQIWAATTQTKFALARLTDTDPPVVDSSKDIVLSYMEMHERIDLAVKALDAVDRDYILEHCDTVKPTGLGEHTVPLSGTKFACIMQANILFHVSTAYGILRKEGVPLGKIDYLLPFV